MDLKMRRNTFKMIFLKIDNWQYVTSSDNLALRHLALIARQLGMKASTIMPV